jgi:hypothetical protein
VVVGLHTDLDSLLHDVLVEPSPDWVSRCTGRLVLPFSRPNPA